MLHTTFRKAKEVGACVKSYRKMVKALGGVKKYGEDTPIPLDKVLEVCGLDDTLWTLRIVIEPAEREIRLYACACAERVLPLFESKYPDNKCPRQAIEIARKFANGEVTKEELSSACAAAWGAAAGAADFLAGATWAAVGSAWAAGATWAAARAARAAWAAARAARAALTAGSAWAAARAADEAAGEWQKARLIEMLNKK